MVGFVKNAKQNIVRTEAERALAEGRHVYTPMLNTPVSQSAGFAASGAVSGWAEMIEAIEEVGWRMEHWAIGQDLKGRAQAYPVFRRAER